MHYIHPTENILMWTLFYPSFLQVVIFFGTLHDLKRECHKIVVSVHLYKILVHLSPNEMLCKALVGDCSLEMSDLIK